MRLATSASLSASDGVALDSSYCPMETVNIRALCTKIHCTLVCTKGIHFVVLTLPLLLCEEEFDECHIPGDN